MSVFLDSNVLLYSEDGASPEKRQIALDLIRAGFRDGATLSTQVLSEFYANAVRKLGLAKSAARERALLFSSLTVAPITPALALSAMDLHQVEPLSFWDALIIRTAGSAGCSVLMSEDLQDGRSYEGVRVKNPFAGASAAR